jgi:hypothetical protein
LGLWFRPKTADDFAQAAVRDSFNASLSARYLSANAPSFRQNLSADSVVKKTSSAVSRRKFLVSSHRANPV